MVKTQSYQIYLKREDAVSKQLERRYNAVHLSLSATSAYASLVCSARQGVFWKIHFLRLYKYHFSEIGIISLRRHGGHENTTKQVVAGKNHNTVWF